MRISAAFQRFAQSLVWAVIVWTLMQMPVVQQSWIGAPDSAGLQNVLQLQKNLVAGDATPVVLVDFSDEDWLAAHVRDSARPDKAPPPAPLPPETPGATSPATPENVATEPAPNVLQSVPLYVPRGPLSEVLDFLSASGAAAVFVDVDTSFAPSPVDDNAYAAAIQRWRATPNAPLLVLARTDWTTPSIFERTGTPAPAPLDRVVEGTVRVWSTTQRVVDNVEYWICEGAGEARAPHASVAVYLAAAARFDDGLKAKTEIARALSQVRCAGKSPKFELQVPRGDMIFDDHSGPIFYHMALNWNGASEEQGTWTSANWPTAILRGPQAARCGNETATVATRIRVMDMIAAIDGGEVSKTTFCGAMVVVGSTARIVRDTFPSPYGTMPGSFILANAARGLDMAGPLRRFPYWTGLGYVVGITILVYFLYLIINQAARRMLRKQPRTAFGRATRFMVDNLTHPLSLSILIANLLFLVGLGLTFFTIKIGYWGVFAACALAASLSNAFDDVSDMREAVIEQDRLGEKT